MRFAIITVLVIASTSFKLKKKLEIIQGHLRYFGVAAASAAVAKPWTCAGAHAIC